MQGGHRVCVRASAETCDNAPRLEPRAAGEERPHDRQRRHRARSLAIRQGFARSALVVVAARGAPARFGARCHPD
jgi:hypothetical protein